MPMTDAPNFETKFGRRKPCLRYIGPPLDPTSVAPVGRGDFTPPNPPCSAPCRGRAPSRPTRPLFPANPRWFPNASPPRVGADLCVRPDTPFCGDLLTGRHAGRPLQIPMQPSSTPGNRAGTEPRPYSRRMSNAGSRSTRPSPPSSPANQNTWNDRRHQSLPLPSPVLTSPVSAKRPRPSFGKSLVIPG